jgi:hypothetical protein
LHFQFESGESQSISKVYDEITRNTDDLSKWLKANLNKKMFIDATQDPEVISKYEDVSAWVMGNERFLDSAKRDFLQVPEADPWLCAFAAVHGCTVVTEEVSDPQARRRVSLADVLDAFEVPYVNVFDFLETQQAKFILEQTKDNCQAACPSSSLSSDQQYRDSEMQ